MTGPSMAIVLEFARTETPEDPYAFRFKPQSYTLRTQHGGRKRVELNWSDELLDDLSALSEPHCSPTTIERVGRALRGFLEPAGWTFYAQSIAQSAQQSHRVHLTIRSAAAELYALPWELLTLDGTGQFVGELPTVLVRYEWPETHTAPVQQHGGPERVLLAWSEAGGAVPHAKHVSAIRAATAAAQCDFAADRDVLGNVSVGRLADALERGVSVGAPISVLHLLCHGGTTGEAIGVMLDDERGRGGVSVDALRLRQILAPYADTLRLVILSACGSAQSGEFDSITQSLHRAGIQGLIGSRFPLSVTGSVTIAETLYRSLLVERLTLEESFLRTRKQLARDASHLDWASLQLYARAADGDETRPLEGCRGPSAASVSRPADDVLGRIAFALLDLPTLLSLRDTTAREIEARYTREAALMCVEPIAPDTGMPADASSRARCRELLLANALPAHGQLFDAGDDLLHVRFPTAKGALGAATGLCSALTEHNYQESREGQLAVRIAIHEGAIITDDTTVAGRPVDEVRHIVECADQGQVLLSEVAVRSLPKLTQALRCTLIEDPEVTASVRGIPVYHYTWRDDNQAPTSVLIEHSGEELALPDQDLISFGRLDLLPDGTPANDIVLTHHEDKILRAISRWHFELRRVKTGYVLRSLSRLGTQVDGEDLHEGQEAPVRVGSVIGVAKRLQLVLKGPVPTGMGVHAATMTMGYTG